MVSHLSWPVAALIGLFALRPYLREIVQFASHLNRLVDKSGELSGLVTTLGPLSEQLRQVNVQYAELKGLQEIVIANKDGGQSAALPGVPPTTPVDIDRMWAEIEQAWEAIKEAVIAVARPVQVKPNFIGSVGVSATMDALVAAGAVKDETANKVRDIAGKWQWMFRTSAPQEDWLNGSVVEGFVKACTDAKSALLRGL